MAGLIVLAIIAALAILLTRESGKRRERESQVAHEVLHHLPSYLREQTGKGPWLEMDHFYRENYVEAKCTRCTRDTTFVCNDNPQSGTECIDVHFKGGRCRILYGDRLFFDGAPLSLISYPTENFAVSADHPPPKESDVYRAWAKIIETSKGTGRPTAAFARRLPTPSGLLSFEETKKKSSSNWVDDLDESIPEFQAGMRIGEVSLTIRRVLQGRPNPVADEWLTPRLQKLNELFHDPITEKESEMLDALLCWGDWGNWQESLVSLIELGEEEQNPEE